MIHRHRERHKLGSVGWLRAAVLGANDGLVSTASLILGVATADSTHKGILVAGIASLVAGAMSMATGEYVSVQSQADAEQAALALERRELEADPKGEHQELAGIYMSRGLDSTLASKVASSLMAHDAMQAHARDELGITDTLSARPLQAAMASAVSFSLGSLLPLLVVVFSPHAVVSEAVALVSLAFLAILGAWAAKAAGAVVWKGALRVSFWSALAMGMTAACGKLVGAFG